MGTRRLTTGFRLGYLRIDSHCGRAAVAPAVNPLRNVLSEEARQRTFVYPKIVASSKNNNALYPLYRIAYGGACCCQRVRTSHSLHITFVFCLYRVLHALRGTPFSLRDERGISHLHCNSVLAQPSNLLVPATFSPTTPPGGSNFAWVDTSWHLQRPTYLLDFHAGAGRYTHGEEKPRKTWDSSKAISLNVSMLAMAHGGWVVCVATGARWDYSHRILFKS